MIRKKTRITVGSFPEFAKYLEQEAPPDAIYRGHAKRGWHLVPVVHRKGVLSAATPKEKVKAEKSMLKQFKRQARSLLQSQPRNDWEWLALARHYGLPTRLLDWTENAAVALFFAVEYPNGGQDSAVWCSRRPAEVNAHKPPFDVDGIYLYEPPYIAARIIAQSACFTVHPTDYIGKQYSWPRSSPIKVIIPAKARVPIRAALRVQGVHRASVFPEPPGIAEEIKRRHSSMEDEKGLYVITATYGIGDRVVDVTQELDLAIRNNGLSINVENALAPTGDPAPGETKELRVSYGIEGKRYLKNVREGKKLRLP